MTRTVLKTGCWLATAVGFAMSVPTAKAQLVAGNFTYQFTDTTAAHNVITTLNIGGVGQFGTVRLYLVQTGGTPTIDQLGLQAAAVRLNYLGQGVRVPDNSPVNIQGNTGNQTTSFGFDTIIRYGSGTGTDTTATAAVSNLLITTSTLAYPTDLGDTGRIFVGQFRLVGVTAGVSQVQAVDPFSGTDDLTGPNPPTSPPGNANGPNPISIDPLLAQNVSSALIPTLTVTVQGVPEPGTLALGGLAAAGLAMVRRRRKTSAATTAA
jgi:hypothetical protein